MTVKKLIEELSELDPSLTVFITGDADNGELSMLGGVDEVIPEEGDEFTKPQVMLFCKDIQISRA